MIPPSYQPRLPVNWWLRNSRYFRYMVRELTAVFAALWALAFLLQLPQMVDRGEGHQMWLTGIQSRGWVIFSLVSLLFVLYHAWTFFASTGTVIHFRLGKRILGGAPVNASMFVAWAAATLVIAFVLATPSIGG